MSLVPVGVLLLFLYEVQRYGKIEVDKNTFYFTVTCIACGMTLGYFTMRRFLLQLIDLTRANRAVLEGILSPQKMQSLGNSENEVAILAQSFTAITNRLEENVKSLELARRTLHTVMSKVGEGITNMQNIDSFLDLIIETVAEAMGAKRGILLLKGDHEEEFSVKTVYGIENKAYRSLKVKFAEDSTMSSIIESQTPLMMQKVTEEFTETKHHKMLFMTPMLCAPLILKDQVIGVIIINDREEGMEFEGDELNLLFNLASQTAVAIENSQLSEDIESIYFETISALALAVDAKDKYSRGHLDRVADYCVQIAERLGLEDNDIKMLRDGARLHDIGKIGIPDEVLGKKGSLNDQEWSSMRKHPEIGESIIKPITSLGHLCDMIRHHHEKLDGSGYPDGLKGDQITPLVRILTVADIYDALTTNRPYRQRYSIHEACKILKSLEDTIDQDIVDVFLETFDED